MNGAILKRLSAIAILAIGSYAYLAFAPTLAERADSYSEVVVSEEFDVYGKFSPTLAIVPGYEVVQAIVPQEDGFSELQLMFTAPADMVFKSNNAIRISLKCDDADVFNQTIKNNQIVLDKPYKITFSPQMSSSGKTYQLRILGEGASTIAEGIHLMLLSHDDRSDWKRVIVNGNSWDYVAYIVTGCTRVSDAVQPLTTTKSERRVYAMIISGLLSLLLFVLWGIEWFRGRGDLPKDAKPRAKVSFDWGMHYFRAFAILSISIEHYLCLTGYTSWSNAWFQTGTVYFLFISGYLCQYLHDKRPESPLSYYKKKILNVITPYLLWSLATITVVYIFGFSCGGVIDINKLRLENLWSIFRYGRAQLQYWYIPFISLVFLVSPLLARVGNTCFYGLLIFFSVLMITSNGQRDVLTLAGNVSCYSLFVAPYLYGMAFSRYRETLEPVFKRYVWVALALGVIIALVISYPGKIMLRYDSVLLQTAIHKLMLTVVAVVALAAISKRKIWFFDQVAKLSFTIYFCHMFVIKDFAICKAELVQRFAVPDVLAMLLFCVVYIVFLVLFSVLLKIAFGKYARSFIGA